jgi:hypothetical protein
VGKPFCAGHSALQSSSSASWGYPTPPGAAKVPSARNNIRGDFNRLTSRGRRSKAQLTRERLPPAVSTPIKEKPTIGAFTKHPVAKSAAARGGSRSAYRRRERIGCCVRWHLLEDRGRVDFYIGAHTKPDPLGCIRDRFLPVERRSSTRSAGLGRLHR